MYSPNTEFLKGISDGLNTTAIPVYFKLPDATVKEPFFVIGNRIDDDSPSSKTGPAIIDTTLTIDLFYPINSRTKLEEAIFQAKKALGRRRSISSDIRIDDSIGREVYHVIFRVTDYIF